jgi:hypothetical protein
MAKSTIKIFNLTSPPSYKNWFGLSYTSLPIVRKTVLMEWSGGWQHTCQRTENSGANFRLAELTMTDTAIANMRDNKWLNESEHQTFWPWRSGHPVILSSTQISDSTHNYLRWTAPLPGKYRNKTEAVSGKNKSEAEISSTISPGRKQSPPVWSYDYNIRSLRLSAHPACAHHHPPTLQWWPWHFSLTTLPDSLSRSSLQNELVSPPIWLAPHKCQKIPSWHPDQWAK